MPRPDRRSWLMKLLGIGEHPGYNGLTRTGFYRHLWERVYDAPSPGGQACPRPRRVVELPSRNCLSPQAQERLRRLPHIPPRTEDRRPG